VATVVVTPTALDDLERLVQTHSLPPDTRSRVKASLRALSGIPLLGSPLTGRWATFRFVLGSWRWMLIVYWYDESTDRVFVVTIQDARSSSAATAGRGG
jgi:mRNA-degrading endonuclease RelE of RelBE toxin-antitoxin system